METSRLRRENQSLRRQDTGPTQMIGASASFKGLISQLDKVTKSNGRVMLTGPAGAGKELAARYIHANSNRAAAPFVTVNCAGVAPDRMEEVLFGRENAERGVEPGLLEQAHGGVIYFDEVADMPLGTQSKILRVLVDQQFTRVGGNDKVRVDLRVISSTNRDLEKAIAAETFRQELFHRLNVVPIAVGRPPRGYSGAGRPFHCRIQHRSGPAQTRHQRRGPGVAANDGLAGQRAPAQEPD